MCLLIIKKEIIMPSINSENVKNIVQFAENGQNPQVLNREEGSTYLSKIGKVGYRDDNKYYYNSIL